MYFRKTFAELEKQRMDGVETIVILLQKVWKIMKNCIRMFGFSMSDDGNKFGYFIRRNAHVKFRISTVDHVHEHIFTHSFEPTGIHRRNSILIIDLFSVLVSERI